MMTMTLSDINDEIKKLKDKRREIFDKALDGRTQRWLSDKTDINEARISACISGIMEFTEEELNSINKVLRTDF